MITGTCRLRKDILEKTIIVGVGEECNAWAKRVAHSIRF